MSELTAQQKGRLKRLVAAETLKQVLTKHNLGSLAILLNGDEVDMFAQDTDRVTIFGQSDNKIALVMDVKDDPDTVDVSIPDVNLFIRQNRWGDFVPEDHGLDPMKPSILTYWPVAAIRQSLLEIAKLPAPPPLKKAITKPVRVVGMMKK